MLEQNSIGYTYPGDINSNSAPAKTTPEEQSSIAKDSSSSITSKTAEDDWQIVIPLPETEQQDVDSTNSSTSTTECTTIDDSSQSTSSEMKDSFGDNAFLPSSGILPAARARLASLRDLGAKKIGALKLKLVESRMRFTEKGVTLFLLVWLSSYLHLN